MQNETNFPTPKINITSALTLAYENDEHRRPAQNETNFTRRWCGRLIRRPSGGFTDVFVVGLSPSNGFVT
jgi:hypothetical protein